MNKYLLLRDNKQTGPYSVPELIEIGIKPYDLVWLEGRSAAWRYPSEIEELKAFSPAVEEQPFDRFYRRPEPILKTTDIATPEIITTVAEHTPYEPKAIDPIVKVSPTEKKVYINFPKKNTTAPKPEYKATPVPIAPEQPSTGFAEQTFYKQANEVIAARHASVKQPQIDKRFGYIAAAAAIIFSGFITVLLVNNNRQQKRLQELNTIVKQIETKKSTENTAQILAVKNDEPAPAPVKQTSETIVNPELLNLDDHNAPATASVSPSKQNTEATVTPSVETKKPTPKSTTTDGIVFTERPVLRRGDKTPAETSGNSTEKTSVATASSENIYKLVEVKPNKFKTGMLGGISNLQLQLTNNSNRELQKVAIQINYLGPEKKVVNSQTVYFENISPGEHATIDVPKSKRGVSINYTITDIKS
jgi:hypothetical protein